MADTVRTTIDERGVARVVLNNPKKHNAFDDTIIAELNDIFSSLDSDSQVRVVVLAAEGINFSAGGDLDWMKRMASYSKQQNLDDARALAEMLRCLNFMCKPTIARVQGAAFGGAVGLVSCCDIAVGSSKVSFSLSEVKIGLVPATISPYVIKAIGQRAARRYFTTAERFDAEEALKLGLLSAVVDENQLDDEVERLVESLLDNGPQAVKAAKRLIFDVAEKEITHELIENTVERIASIRVAEEGQEGLNAFLQKRPASWKKN